MDEYIGQTKDKICDTLVHFGRKGLNVAATAAVMAATKVLQTLDIFVVLLTRCFQERLTATLFGILILS